MHDGRGPDCAGRTERMAERNRAAKWIDLGRVQFAVAYDGQCLCSEGFVEFDPIQLVIGEAGLLERLRNRGDRTDAHHFRAHASDRETDEASQRSQAVILDRLLRSEEYRARVIEKLDVTRLVVCGLSYGAWIATSFAMRHPEKLAAYVQANNLFRAAPVVVERFCLFSSRLGKEQAVYVPEVEYGLG